MTVKSRTSRAIAVVAAIVATAGVGTGTASAHQHPTPKPVVSPPIIDGLAGPLQIEVSHRGSVLVGQSFGGTVSLVSPNGTIASSFEAPGVDGVAAGWFGSTLYTHTDDGVAQILSRSKSGKTRVVADTYAYEAKKNPDRKQSYGFFGLSDECAALFPPDSGIPPYTGIVDSHPYAITPALGGVLVADAGANAILYADLWGRVHTVAVLPPQAPLTVTEEIAEANELPPCVVGARFVAEPVPTDVEIGRDGYLYVSTLPGGPEDPSLGARGSVYRVNPWTGSVRQIATGFLGAANLAVSPRGTIYVSELFGDQVSKVVGGHAEPVASVPSPAALEWSNGKLYVGADAFGSGKIVTISPAP